MEASTRVCGGSAFRWMAAIWPPASIAARRARDCRQAVVRHFAVQDRGTSSTLAGACCRTGSTVESAGHLRPVRALHQHGQNVVTEVTAQLVDSPDRHHRPGLDWAQQRGAARRRTQEQARGGNGAERVAGWPFAAPIRFRAAATARASADRVRGLAGPGHADPPRAGRPASPTPPTPMACIAHTLAALGADHTLAADPDVLQHLQDTAHRTLRAAVRPKAATRNRTYIL